jgi:lipoyl(octanoyl) transferase
VLHIDELTYSVLAAPGAEPWCGTQAESYRRISQAVAEALAQEGLGVTLDRGYPVEKPQAMRAMTPCFSSTARSEVVWGDRKLVGSAQRRLRGAFLQHGSILISRAHRKVVDCLRLDAEKRARYLEILDRNAVCLEDALGRALDWSALAGVFQARFAQALGVEYAVGGLSGTEAAMIAEATEAKTRQAAGLLVAAALPAEPRPAGMPT